MGSLKHAVLRLGVLSVPVGAVAVSGRIGLYLTFGVIVFILGLIAVLAPTGTFGAHDRRKDAQAVLAIPPDRNQLYDPGALSTTPAARAGRVGTRAGSGQGSRP